MPSGSCELFLGGLSREVRRKDLEEVFGKYGTMTRCDIKYMNGHMGTTYGFIGFMDEQDARDALKYENGRKICGHAIKIEPTKTKAWTRSERSNQERSKRSRSRSRSRHRHRSSRHRNRRSRSRSSYSSRSRSRSSSHDHHCRRKRRHHRHRRRRHSSTSRSCSRSMSYSTDRSSESRSPSSSKRRRQRRRKNNRSRSKSVCSSNDKDCQTEKSQKSSYSSVFSKKSLKQLDESEELSKQVKQDEDVELDECDYGANSDDNENESDGLDCTRELVDKERTQENEFSENEKIDLENRGVEDIENSL